MAKERVGIMKKPVPEEFGITTEDYNKIEANPEVWRNGTQQVIVVIISISVGLYVGLTDNNFGTGAGTFFGSMVILTLVGCALEVLIRHYHPLYRKAKLYKRAKDEFQLTLKKYWMSLKGTNLENKLGNLYKKLGYRVDFTPPSGDLGVDLFLNKDGKNIIVQCKGHKKPIGPAVVRELYGTLIEHKYVADSAILVCPSGFTKGAKESILGKPMQLISATELVEMAESVGQESSNR